MLADAQREIVAEIANHAMIAGWDTAIKKKGKELRISVAKLRDMLDEAAKYNDKADPNGRIHELEDWKIEQQGRSQLAPRARASSSR